MRSVTVVVLAVLALAMPARSQDDESFGITTAEFGGALLGGAVGAVAVGAAAHGIASLIDEGYPSVYGLTHGWGAGVGLGIGYPLGSAAGTAFVGHLLQQDGRFWPTAAGAGIGVPVGALTVLAGWSAAIVIGCLGGSEGTVLAVGWTLTGLGIMAPPALAVVAYNNGFDRSDEWSRRRLMVAPEFALVGSRDHRSLSTGVGIRLAI